MDIIIMAAQLILGLSILVGLHELGHLVAAKAFGMRVEQYSIGFPPKIFGVKIGETVYSLGAIPLGGFVKISGMVDESLDTKNLDKEPEPWEFRAKPAWQRLIVMMGGIIVNVITGVIIFVWLAYSYGESYLSKEQLNQHGIVAYEIGEEIGLKTGDRILEVNGRDYRKFSDLRSTDVILGSNSFYTVQRGEETLRVDIPKTFLDRMSDDKAAERFIDFRIPFRIAEVVKGMPAEEAGLQSGDYIVGVNGREVKYYDEFLAMRDQYKGEEMNMQIMRGEEKLEIAATSTETGELGFRVEPLIDFSFDSYDFSAAVAVGSNDAFNVVWDNIRGIGKIFSGEVSASKSLSGPIGIAKIYGDTWDWYRFWKMTGLLSMILAFMNFLPIPALDGGHVAFLSYEMISGRKPSDGFLEGAQKVGMVLLLGLMTFAIFNDIFKAVF